MKHFSHLFLLLRHNAYTSTSEYTCSLVGDPYNVVVGRDRGGVVVYSDYNILISSGGPSNGTAGVCTIETSCTHSSYYYASLYCDSWLLPPDSLTCWLSSDSSKPVCVQPGSAWVASLVGCIIAGVSGIAFLLFAWCLQKSIARSPSLPMITTSEVYVGEPVVVAVAQPTATVQAVPAGRVVQGTVVAQT